MPSAIECIERLLVSYDEAMLVNPEMLAEGGQDVYILALGFHFTCGWASAIHREAKPEWKTVEGLLEPYRGRFCEWASRITPQANRSQKINALFSTAVWLDPLIDLINQDLRPPRSKN